MMSYQEIEIVTELGAQKHIVIAREDGSFVSFPMDNTNPDYLAWLAEQPKENTVTE